MINILKAIRFIFTLMIIFYITLIITVDVDFVLIFSLFCCIGINAILTVFIKELKGDIEK